MPKTFFPEMYDFARSPGQYFGGVKYMGQPVTSESCCSSGATPPQSFASGLSAMACFTTSGDG
eukprot:CAMPEP_0181536866 /NCGR_PEP_ID=MMETSP1110-20121109/75052_1 /TAXON_ID=174948 /ORGANISM="Symbiodinium sp., Strain CCMP421" /LENGTH=62 /DNA_ID=CAMNT_0023668411 /DNA_START=304 /DNA_END=488 /DNA_ORIENTATION=-